MKPVRPRLTYANVVATLALFLALGGGAAFAASKITSGDIAAGAIKTANLHERAVTSGKLAIGAVRGNQVAAAALSSAQIKPGSIEPASLQVPVTIDANPSGGSFALQNSAGAYPLTNATWTQSPGEIQLVTAGGTASLAYDGLSVMPVCSVALELRLNGHYLSSISLNTGSETAEQVPIQFPVAAAVEAPAGGVDTLTARVTGSGCAAGSAIDSLHVRVIGVG